MKQTLLAPAVVALAFVALQPCRAQSESAPRDFAAEIRATVREATLSAGREFPLTVLDLCYMSAPTPPDTLDTFPPPERTATGYRERPRENWYVEPARVFDDLYF